ncbi:hypothetical protein [Rhizobium leguminosarum]|uniref:hypothetical protein n=1 Tax=Rhizobium leguminosarum TaxID=384 RepID=UPI00160FF31A|nr:hypothetical protein [Rhizobium leguminosarum]MBB4341394.1 hypothetical protein [Rhizobium leguminosarum]MBB6294018.1 hypothetical protein [Rhizobium leguminosarum]
MTIGELIWKGRAWPKAFVGKTLDVVYKDSADGGRTGTGKAFDIQTTGKGREYEILGRAAWWRNFSELDVTDPDAVIRFVRRRGDPFGDLEHRDYADTLRWPVLAALLKPAAGCWTSDRSGTSVFAASPIEQRRAIETMIWSEHWLIDYQPFVDDSVNFPLSIRMAATSLAAFMIASAVEMTNYKTKMAICEHCGDWFEELRSGTRFCTPSCRAAYSASKKERK